ncbi:NAD(P)-dependent glycerol-3-phosphate dehydrogenase [Thiotrichales bacterium 19S11-10]|nr:NAD(P)-dependent glycerol-3-phosphate dehydrogenase [Thiotrichales bacterium 19S11-10]
MNSPYNSPSCLVMGAGSWGTALALHLASLNHQIYLYAKDKNEANDMITSGVNKRYLPDHPFPENLVICHEFESIIKKTNHILIAVPSHAFKSVLTQLSPLLTKEHQVLWATKGLCSREHKLLSEVAKEKLPSDTPYGMITGPSFAKEVASHMPTAIVIASSDMTFAKNMQAYWNGPSFRVYTSQDIIGVQIGGAVKNVLAIAVGTSDGLGFGSNAKAALITRGLAEMSRLGLKLGADKETLSGLACLGDLVLTCTDNQSRNRRFGLLLGQGKSITEALETIDQVVEGYETTQHIYHLAKKLEVDMPIVFEAYQVLYEGKEPLKAVQSLMQRQLKDE